MPYVIGCSTRTEWIMLRSAESIASLWSRLSVSVETLYQLKDDRRISSDASIQAAEHYVESVWEELIEALKDDVQKLNRMQERK